MRGTVSIGAHDDYLYGVWAVDDVAYSGRGVLRYDPRAVADSSVYYHCCMDLCEHAEWGKEVDGCRESD